MKPFYCTFLLFAFLFSCSFSYCQSLLAPATISYQVLDMTTGNIVTETNGQMCATPASITKLITTATALELLGPNYTFKTRIQHDGTLSNGTIHGNLYIKGGGDPTLGSMYMGDPTVIKNWARQLKAQGIKRIEGDIIADATCFDKEPIPVQWSWEDMGNYYAAGVYGLSFYDNTMLLTFQSGAPGTKPRLIRVSPNIPELSINNQLNTLRIPADSGYIYGMPYDNYRIVQGGIPANKERYTLRGDIPNPPMLVSQLLDSALREVGITVTGQSKDYFTSLLNRQTLITYESPKLSDIVKLTNFKSNNLYAEHIFKSLALTRYNVASNAKAIQVIKDYWNSKGIDVSSLFMLDGSGLSPQGAFSAQTLNQILRYMYLESPNKNIFLNSIPKAGLEGTVAGFMAKTPLVGSLWLKSGSFSRVQAYSGYYINGNKHYAVTVIVNNWNGSRSEVRKEIKQWLLKLSE